ncbi:MAG TPA: YciI family protein [Mycobacteriales bacterium]
MRFLVLLTEKDHFDIWDAADADLRRRTIDDYNAFGDAVRKLGTLVVGDALARPEEARTRRPGGSVTRGPFAETVEQIGGFYLVDLPDLDTAVEVAGLLPREYTIEVRPTVQVEV